MYTVISDLSHGVYAVSSVTKGADVHNELCPVTDGGGVHGNLCPSVTRLSSLCTHPNL